MRLSELQSKDVIREEDGVRLGRITDVTVDVATGKILNVSICNGFKLSSIFGSKDHTLIAWDKIIKIGSDVIIVDNNRSSKKEIDKKT